VQGITLPKSSLGGEKLEKQGDPGEKKEGALTKKRGGALPIKISIRIEGSKHGKKDKQPEHEKRMRKRGGDVTVKKEESGGGPRYLGKRPRLTGEKTSYTKRHKEKSGLKTQRGRRPVREKRKH